MESIGINRPIIWDLKMKWLELVTTLKNIFTFRKVLSKHPPHALYFNGMAEMLYFQLGITLQHRYDHPWADKATIPELKRFRELLKHFIDDDYIERCGGVDHTKFNRLGTDFKGQYHLVDVRTPEEKQRDEMVMAKVEQLKTREHGELLLYFAKGLKNGLDRPA